MKVFNKKTAPWLLLSTGLLLIDLLTKKWAETALAPVETMPLVEGIIGLRYAENTGAAFSAFAGATVWLSLISLAVCTVVLVYVVRHPEMGRLEHLSLSMVLSGGIGNLIDRIARGYVVDFFEFQFVDFAVFNFADIFITVGAALLFIALLRGGEIHARVEN